MNGWIWPGLNIVAWLIAALAWWFSDTTTIKERIAVAETRIEQETRGYYVLQTEINRRLERLETKVDRIIERRNP